MLEVILPIFSIVALGYGLAKKQIFNEATGQGLTRFMFYVAVPAMLFDTISTTRLPAQIPWDYLLAFYVPSLLIFILAMFLMAFFFNWQQHQRGIAGVCASYSNMVLLGLPLLLAAYGEKAVLPLFLLLAPQSLLLFPTTIFAVEIYGRRSSINSSLGLTLAKKLLLNPVILSLLAGLMVNFYNIPIATPLAKMLDIIGAAAPACALTALGVSLAQYTLRNIQVESFYLACLKIFIHPMLVFAACTIFEIDLLWMQVAVFLAAMPCGINAFIFASSYQIKAQTITHSIVLSTLMCVITSAVLLRLFENMVVPVP
ncbi:MAG: AEC family transporter [Gammaproteobacteria bacterium]